ncbi:MAG: GNAT family N-acetyltransferase [Candidatus Rokubacteria bacterium]|nr:GNAT family N-acetyltransferase [Candidatus Rokubacteria bacterium]MBI2525588.1 GNAT family N-acetyltransferase [Candidatus Rokubacteria bacterium]MBI3106032.1 GNAT family N-acetyltransferase [Candidatus Rokubacteria bacterium]
MGTSDPPTPPPEAIPREFDRQVVLRDGARVWLRAIRPDDEARLVDLYGRLSHHTAYQRFFTVLKRLPPDWAHFFANVDYRKRMALVAEHEHEGRLELIGVGRYEPADEAATAEVAFVVQDGWQGRGLGAVLLDDVTRAGEARGVLRFRAFVLADNDRMLDLLTRFTDVLERKLEDGVVSLVFRRQPAPPPTG